MSWGQELWDCYDKVCGHVSSGSTNINNTYAKFFKEKAEVEREYAKGLRRLVAKYQQKPSKVETETYDESTMFAKVLLETGYIAGQHEIVADTLVSNIAKDVQTKSIEFIGRIKNNIKTYKKEKDKLKMSQFDLEKSKLKYLKSFHDWEESESNYQSAEKDGTLARNEILRIKLESEAKHKYYIHQTEAYQNQLKTTNTDQNNYYKVLLPDFIDKLETVERDRLDFVKNIYHKFIQAEKDVNIIMTKCRDDMESAVSNMRVENDINLVVDVNKSGDLPPGEIPFIQTQQLREKKSKGSSLSRRLTMSHLHSKQSPNKQNLFQKKRKLLKSIDKSKAEYEKGTKEVQALQLMINTYKENPEYGNVKKFEQELKLASDKVNRLDTELSSLNRELDLVESAMCLNIRHSLLSSHDSYSEGSDGTSHNSVDTSDTLDTTDVTDDGKHSEDSGEWSDDGSEMPPKKLLALYSYGGEEEGTLMMDAGDEFDVIEEDVDGWTRVRRSRSGEEGFIPTGFTSPITVLKI